jgi:hypothetical protein
MPNLVHMIDTCVIVGLRASYTGGWPLRQKRVLLLLLLLRPPPLPFWCPVVSRLVSRLVPRWRPGGVPVVSHSPNVLITRRVVV